MGINSKLDYTNILGLGSTQESKETSRQDVKTMRIFTENDRLALTAAMRTFYSSVSGTLVKTATCLEQINRALDAGLTVDELLNRHNMSRVMEVTEKPDIATYIEALIDRTVLVRPLRREPSWSDPDGFSLYADMFHDFYQKINGTGGVYTTSTAKANLMKVISRYSLQTILSEKLINEVMEKTGEGENLTCFNYIKTLLLDAENYDLEDGLSKEQRERKQLEEESGRKITEVEREADGEATVSAENASTENDESIYDEYVEENDEAQDMSFIATLDPQEYKRNFLAELINNTAIADQAELCRFIKDADPDRTTSAELVEALKNGKIDTKNESVSARNIHQALKEQLFPHFIECLAMQGIQVSPEVAAKMDFLTESWDMRDNNTRKLQKAKELFYREDIDDPDLLEVIEDLKQLYTPNQ